MSLGTLEGMRVAILATDGFEEEVLLEPRMALDRAGAATFVIFASEDKVKGWSSHERRTELAADIPLKAAKAEDFHALLLPGGVISADRLSSNRNTLQFVRDFIDAGKPVAAICDGTLTILEAGVVRGRTMTAPLLLRTDLENAGAKWVDKDVVCDGKLVTGRNADDIPAFDREMIRLFAEDCQHSPDIRSFY
jgi:protease I